MTKRTSTRDDSAGRPKRILEDFTLLEVSLVDRPAQSPALADITKRHRPTEPAKWTPAPTPAPAKPKGPSLAVAKMATKELLRKAADAGFAVEGLDDNPTDPAVAHRQLNEVADTLKAAAQAEYDSLVARIQRVAGADEGEARRALESTAAGERLAGLLEMTRDLARS